MKQTSIFGFEGVPNIFRRVDHRIELYNFYMGHTDRVLEVQHGNPGWDLFRCIESVMAEEAC